MKVDVTRHILGIDGEPLIEDGEKGPTELRVLLCRALDYTGGKGTSPKEAVDRYRAMHRIATEDEPEIEAEIVVALKEGLSKMFVPRIAGQAILMLEGGS